MLNDLRADEQLMVEALAPYLQQLRVVVCFEFLGHLFQVAVDSQSQQMDRVHALLVGLALSLGLRLSRLHV